MEDNLFDFRKIDKEYILKNIGQERIFEKYLNMKINLKGAFCSPLRVDKNPTCRFKYTNGNLYFIDYSGHFKGNCFDLVMFIFNVDFKTCLDIISNDFNIKSIDFKPKRKVRIYEKAKIEDSIKKEIKVRWNKFSKFDLDYWNSSGLRIQELNKYYIAPVSHVWLNDNLIHRYSEEDPSYAYWFSNDEIKVYFPKRREYRFLCNTNCIQGYSQLKEKGDHLIITKAMKDLALLDRYRFNSIAYQSETQIPSEKDILEFRNRFNKIYTFLDFDLTGIRTSNKMRKLYGTLPIFLTNGRFGSKNYHAKDPSDLFRNSKKEFKNFISQKLY